jgi:uncharacterized protein (TIGR02598 family)
MSARVFSRRAWGTPAFSLLEVVIATGLCAGAIGAVLALLPPLLTAMADAEQRTTALRVVTLLDARWSTAPWAEVVAAVETGEVWYANASGARLETAENAIWAGTAARPSTDGIIPHFELAAVRDARLSGPAVLVYAVEIRWPASTGDGHRVTDRSAQSSLVLLSARTR